ncbi:hypothetical protein L211DRAFT_338761 [Terfezia boudieri ATCC MYA-4762]|uniref:Uncharacterized protein n=1 Tax=Terfezia boudieri ATCC MYA-4762 TaxID=1051890 RepID=A0A3N4LP33_9PEZI|nr:hypothetical protein L211DRAFT_338761 [Terfezia boudieri ATCC MYA-4762]
MAGVSTPARKTESVQLCPECRTSKRRPVAPGRKLCPQHLENKRENQKTRRQRAKLSANAQQRSRTPNSRVQSSNALSSTEQVIPALPTLQQADDVLNRPHQNHIPSSSPVIGPQQFQTYMHGHSHSTLVGPVQSMPGGHNLLPAPNNSGHLGPEQTTPSPQQPAGAPTLEESLTAESPVLSLLEPAPPWGDSGYRTGALMSYWPKDLILSAPGGSVMSAHLPDMVNGSVSAMGQQYPQIGASQPLPLPTREPSMNPASEWIAENTFGMNEVINSYGNKNSSVSPFGENTISEYDFTMNAGHAMAATVHPHIRYSMAPPQSPQLGTPVLANMPLHQSPAETVAFEQFGEGQASEMPSLPTEQDWALF